MGVNPIGRDPGRGATCFPSSTSHLLGVSLDGVRRTGQGATQGTWISQGGWERNVGTGQCGSEPPPSAPWNPRELTVPKKSVSGAGLG